MILDAFAFFSFLSFFLVAFGFWIKNRYVSIAGTTLLLLVGLVLLVPARIGDFSSGLDLKNGTTEFRNYQYDSLNRTDNITISIENTYENYTDTYTYGFGLTYVLIAFYLLLMLYTGRL